MNKKRFVSISLRCLSALAAFILLLFICVEVQEEVRYRLTLESRIKKASYKEEKIRSMLFGESYLNTLRQHCDRRGKNYIKELSYRAILYDYELSETTRDVSRPIPKSVIRRLESLPYYNEVLDLYQCVLQDLVYFPVPLDMAGYEKCGFDNSYGAPRTYGGERTHEGTDIIPSTKERGYFPVVSVSDGVVINKGWLELGGWRLYIKSNRGGYFYYAHLDSYAANLTEGDQVKAGQLLGFMGDTGYGKKEGTKGKFIVHLHFGIYVERHGEHISVNPYPVLKMLEPSRLAYYY